MAYHRQFNPLNAELNPICHLLALLGGATIVVVSRLRVKYTRGEDDVGVPPSLSVRETLLDKQYSESYEAARTNLVSARGTRKKSYKILVVRITQNKNR